MSLKIRFYCLKFSIFIVSLLILQTSNAQRKEKPLLTKYNFSELDKILEEKQGPSREGLCGADLEKR
jgi:hypothetical protein